jgi:ferredoxin-NADP reductase
MLTLIDSMLNRVTMYRLVLYELTLLLAVALVFSTLGILHLSPVMLVFSVVVIVLLCWAVNTLFATVFEVHTNVESLYISALILALLITPPTSFTDGAYLELAFWASVWTMASKYIFAIQRKHIFNPVALGLVIPALALNQSASWWIATLPMMPFVLIGGLLITRKILRFDLVLSFIVVSFLMIVLPHAGDAASILPTLWKSLINVPVLFFATVMLTEPLTTPATRGLRIVYGAITGVLFAPWIRIGSLTLTPELALVLGNVFSYLVSPKEKLLLTLRKKIPVADGIVDFWFSSDRTLRFRPGQYLEWTLSHDKPDSRGNRRYFTISSSPGEEGIAMGIRFYEPSSTFKQKLLAINPGDTLVASQLAGEFVLPKNPAQKIVLIAGGIGVTPFRSMIRDLLDRREQRPITLLFSNRTAADIAYRDVFDRAAELGIKTVYTLTDKTAVPAGWTGAVGRIDEAMIRKEVPDFAERQFFLSGTHAMVTGCETVLLNIGVKKSQITKDFFPGFV